MMPVCDVSLYIEFSALGRLHAHGTIRIKDIFVFYLSVIPSLKAMAGFEIDTISDPSWEETYIHKCKLIMGDHPRKISTALLKEKAVTIFNTKTTVEDIPKKSKLGRPRTIKFT